MQRVHSGMMLGAAVWLALLLLPGAGCILIVPGIDHSSGHCEITGQTACATCLRTSCQATVDACCNDTACSAEDGHAAILDALDACGAGDAAACADGIGKGESPAVGAIRGCVTGACRAVCLGEASVNVEWSCSVARTRENTCATCIYDSCGSAIDECCTDGYCKSSSVTKDLGRCVGGDDAGCAYLVKNKGESGYDGKVRGCIARECAAPCFAARSHQSCSFQLGGSSCSCTDAERASGPDCSTATTGWSCLLEKSSCTCGHYACGSSTHSVDGCSCDFRGDGDTSTSCRAPSGGHCCLTHRSGAFECECRDSATDCSSTLDEYPVETCDIADVRAGLINVLVPRCSN